ncbi:hypothetical protein PRUPE_4G004700 [Prunus persica]|uniref:Uncharacterized protein n=1 Tax=Prunus persica TaxID=3760 RepID=A0A251PDQ0_PRUPE|nr:hypothetical protein PRUPE_4G004700 [Prunus persica]
MSLLGGGIQASETWQAKDHIYIYIYARSIAPPTSLFHLSVNQDLSIHPISFYIYSTKFHSGLVVHCCACSVALLCIKSAGTLTMSIYVCVCVYQFQEE